MEITISLELGIVIVSQRFQVTNHEREIQLDILFLVCPIVSLFYEGMSVNLNIYPECQNSWWAGCLRCGNWRPEASTWCWPPTREWWPARWWSLERERETHSLHYSGSSAQHKPQDWLMQIILINNCYDNCPCGNADRSTVFYELLLKYYSVTTFNYLVS